MNVSIYIKKPNYSSTYVFLIQAVAAPRGGGQSEALPVTCLPVRRKNAKHQPFSTKFWIFASQNRILPPQCPPTKNVLVPPLKTNFEFDVKFADEKKSLKSWKEYDRHKRKPWKSLRVYFHTCQIAQAPGVFKQGLYSNRSTSVLRTPGSKLYTLGLKLHAWP